MVVVRHRYVSREMFFGFFPFTVSRTRAGWRPGAREYDLGIGWHTRLRIAGCFALGSRIDDASLDQSFDAIGSVSASLAGQLHPLQLRFDHFVKKRLADIEQPFARWLGLARRVIVQITGPEKS
jgi:hypothetical protein